MLAALPMGLFVTVLRPSPERTDFLAAHIGIGVAVFSRTKLEDNNIGQAFQFEDRLGFGLRFTGGHEVGIRATHYSNAGISSSNDGVESYSLHYTMPL